MVQFGDTTIVLKQGDITEEVVDAIVNAANSALITGGGVDAAIHRKGGPLIDQECAAIIERQGRCEVGNAVVTGAGNLLADMVIHSVGPVWHGGSSDEEQLLRQAYLSSLVLASKSGASTIAFPSISTGAYRFPIERAAQIALSAIREYCEEVSVFEEIRMVLFSSNDLSVYQQTLNAMIQGITS